jgi:hypothetical protein
VSITILEWFGRTVDDSSPGVSDLRFTNRCPFILDACAKQFPDGTRSGVCSIQTTEGALAICPNRLYANDYRILIDAAEVVFGSGVEVVFANNLRKTSGSNRVLAIGKRSGGEIRLPNRGKHGSYFVDWILARLTPANELAAFVALEVQTMDTTGTYKPEVLRLRKGATSVGPSVAGPNWENVNKRILPQLIYKGHVLRREAKCTHGLFFVCPEAVLNRIKTRLGDKLLNYPNLQPGSITFVGYDLRGTGSPRKLSKSSSFSTTVDQVANAFVSPTNLPPVGSYEDAINDALSRLC